MSQRVSGYNRHKKDLYETPPWVTRCLLPHLPPRLQIWEPAAASGKMVRALRAGGHSVMATEIRRDIDFLKVQTSTACHAIITNPPYTLAREFIEQALLLTYKRGIVAMLLRADYDHGSSRRHLFGACPAFAKKITLTRRIIWFPRPGAKPSDNHAWFIWDYRHAGAPTIAYGPLPGQRAERRLAA